MKPIDRHLNELQQLLNNAPLGNLVEGHIQLCLKTDVGPRFFTIRMASSGLRLIKGPRPHPVRMLSISGHFEDWKKFYDRPHALDLGELKLWGATELLRQLFSWRTQPHSLISIRLPASLKAGAKKRRTRGAR